MREWLKKLRVKKNLSQQNVAKQLGIRQQYYCMIENGERQKDMSVSMAEKLADVLEIPIDTVLQNEKNR